MLPRQPLQSERIGKRSQQCPPPPSDSIYSLLPYHLSASSTTASAISPQQWDRESIQSERQPNISQFFPWQSYIRKKVLAGHFTFITGQVCLAPCILFQHHIIPCCKHLHHPKPARLSHSWLKHSHQEACTRPPGICPFAWPHPLPLPILATSNNLSFSWCLFSSREKCFSPCSQTHMFSCIHQCSQRKDSSRNPHRNLKTHRELWSIWSTVWDCEPQQEWRHLCFKATSSLYIIPGHSLHVYCASNSE